MINLDGWNEKRENDNKLNGEYIYMIYLCNLLLKDKYMINFYINKYIKVWLVNWQMINFYKIYGNIVKM
jgi:hypothetical protein